MIREPKEVDGKKWLSGWGNDEAKVMLICSHPGKDDLTGEDATGYVMHAGAFYDEVKNALDYAGIHEDDCWFTSMVKFGIGSKDKPTAEQITACAEALDEEIKEVNPKLIITLGAEVFKRVMKKNIAQGDYVGEVIDCPYGKALPNFSPAQVYIVDPKLRSQFKDNFYVAKRFISDTLKYKDYQYIVVEDPAVNAAIIAKYIADEKFDVGYDAEWKGKFMFDEVMYTFQYSCEPNKAIVLKILQNGKENLELLHTMKPLIEHEKVRRRGWNIRADDKRLKERNVNPREDTLRFDGMKAVAFFDSRWPKGLETGIKRFTDYRPYYTSFYEALRKHKIKKNDMSDLMHKDPNTFFSYCAGDAVAHREACINMENEMEEAVREGRMPASVRDYYFDTYLPMTNYFMDMELHGIPIDIDCLTKLTEQYVGCYDELNESLMELTKKYGFDTVAYDVAKETGLTKEELEEKGIFKDFNPRSSKDKVKLFFKIMKLTPAYYVKKGKTKPKKWYEKQKANIQAQYNPSANGKCVASIKFELASELAKEGNKNNEELRNKYEVIKTYLDLARVSVFSHKFLSRKGVDIASPDEEDPDDFEELEEDSDDETPLKSSYWAGMAKDNRIHADYYECLDNFRSSSRPNVQNPASKVLSHIPGIFENLKLDVPKNIRNIFYSGHKDYYFAEVDVAGADLAIAAFLSKDKEYIYDIRKGGFHTTKMREYFNDTTLSKENASKYVTSKSITFRVAYTSGLTSAAIPIQAEIFAENGNLVKLELIEYALNTWLRYETYMDYREQCQDQVTNEQCITNARGMKYSFDETDNFAIKAGWMNQALAYPIASELALFMWDVSVQMKEHLKKDKVWNSYVYPVNVVHDANYWIIHKDLLKDNYFPEIAKYFFTDKVRIATGDKLGMEMVISNQWKGKEKILTNETIWDFKEKTWKWAN